MAVLFFVISCIGCANIHYLTPAGEEFNYTRLGMQKIQGFKMSKDPSGIVKFSFDSQEGTEGQAIASLAKTIENLSSLVKVVP